jgi:hypothetical protein
MYSIGTRVYIRTMNFRHIFGVIQDRDPEGGYILERVAEVQDFEQYAQFFAFMREGNTTGLNIRTMNNMVIHNPGEVELWPHQLPGYKETD